MSFATKLKAFTTGVLEGAPAGVQLGLQIGSAKRAEGRMDTQEIEREKQRIRNMANAGGWTQALKEAETKGFTDLAAELRETGKASFLGKGTALGADTAEARARLTSPAPEDNIALQQRITQQRTAAGALTGGASALASAVSTTPFLGEMALPQAREAVVLGQQLSAQADVDQTLLEKRKALDLLAPPDILRQQLEDLKPAVLAAGWDDAHFMSYAKRIETEAERMRDREAFSRASIIKKGESIREIAAGAVTPQTAIILNGWADVLDEEAGIRKEQRVAMQEGRTFSQEMQDRNAATDMAFKTLGGVPDATAEDAEVLRDFAFKTLEPYYPEFAQSIKDHPSAWGLAKTTGTLTLRDAMRMNPIEMAGRLKADGFGEPEKNASGEYIISTEQIKEWYKKMFGKTTASPGAETNVSGMNFANEADAILKALSTDNERLTRLLIYNEALRQPLPPGVKAEALARFQTLGYVINPDGTIGLAVSATPFLPPLAPAPAGEVMNNLFGPAPMAPDPSQVLPTIGRGAKAVGRYLTGQQ